VLRLVICVAAFLLYAQAALLAQRELHWDALIVSAHLNADGSLTVAEDQTMVFSGDWNGGERVFSIRPRQALSLDGMSRWNGSGWQPMREDGGLSRVDDYSLTDDRTLRWRSRLPSDPPFERTSIRYQLRYTLAGILLRDGDRFTLDHDFAFPDRVGGINRFELRLTLDPVWQPLAEVRSRYSATNLAPGKSFVVTVPMRYSGTGSPSAFDDSRSPAVRLALLVIAGFGALSIAWLLASEYRKGRFIPVQTDGIDEVWLRDHILKYPAEMVSAAWDDSIGQAEVVTLLARLNMEGKLESSAEGSGMALRLMVDRETLSGYERKLVDALFLYGRSTTSTGEVKRHYSKTGLDLVAIIRPDLAAALKATFPFASTSWFYRFETLCLFLAGLGLAIAAWFYGELPGPAVFLLPAGCVILGLLASIGGWRFHKRMDRGLGSAVLSLISPVVVAAGVALFIWYPVGSGAIELGALALASLVALTLAVVAGCVNSLRSGQHRDGVAFRKRLTAGRMYFMSQLAAPQPALRDEWYPWLLAFELEKNMDRWSVAYATPVRSRGRSAVGSMSSSSTSSESSAPSWSGFGGGRSGGAGAGASWTVAAGGLAAGVSAPSSSSSSSSGGGSSGGGSSGGGGGGGW
jgi:hypothetical protein